MPLYSDQLPRISIVQLRAGFKPAAFRQLRTVQVRQGDVVCDVAIVDAEGTGCVDQRRWLRCHTCGRRANVLGFVMGFAWSCRRCIGWRARGRAREVRAATAALAGGDTQ